MPLDRYVAQVVGNSLDVQKGRQMPCHYSWRPAHFVAWSSCIGTQLPHAVGVAYGAKYRRQPIVVLAYLGDGATSEPDFHAALNFAGIWKVPVVFLCQNNQWAISVPVSLQTASESIAAKAAAYGLPGVRADGNDVLAVYGATVEAVSRARAGEGPTLIEAVTYRMGAHSSSDDPKRYRKEEETAEWARRDPIERLRAYLESRGLWDRAREEALLAELDGMIQEAVAKVEAAPPMPVETMLQDVYAESSPYLRWELEELRGTTRRPPRDKV
jgi:pyruvate dehydrogenase E1 component alpha subunit/2-oxoisovalerate dehydrogenase E1 component alpha subunit